MAKAKEKTNKAELVRDMMKSHKGKMPAEISALLKSEKGVDIPASYVSVIKSQLRRRKRARKLVKKAAGPAADTTVLFAAAQLVEKAGGVVQAQAALDAVKRVAEIVG